MKELLTALFALSLLHTQRKPTKELYAALKSPALNVFYKEIPSLKSTCANFMRGDIDFSDIGPDIQAFYLRYKAMPTSKLPIVNLLSGFASWYKTDSTSGYSKMEKASASQAFPDWVRHGFIKDIGSQTKVGDKLRALVKRMSGKAEIGFASPEEASVAKTKYPEVYREYLAQRKAFNDIWKGFMSNFVRKSGKPAAPYQDLLKAFADNGIQHGLPAGFTGMVDANGQWYTNNLEIVTSPPQVNMFPVVKMNKEFEDNDTWVYVAVRPDGSLGNYGYMQKTSRANTKQKFERVRELIDNMEGIRKKWMTHILKYDGNALSTSCVLLELLYQTHARVGSPAKNNGLVCLLRSNYREVQGGFNLHYLGKDSVDTKHAYKSVDPVSKKIVGIVSRLAAGKSPKDYLFTWTNERGASKPMTPAMVSATFRKMGAPDGVTPHKLRTYHGTKLFLELREKAFGKYKSFKTPQQAMEVLKEMATHVGTALNHVRTTADGGTKATPATALSAYIDHSAQIEFFQHYGMPLPKHLQRSQLEASVKGLPTLTFKSRVNSRGLSIDVSAEVQSRQADEPAKTQDQVNKPVKPKEVDTKPKKPVEPVKMKETESNEPPLPKEAKPAKPDSEDDAADSVPQTVGNLEVTQADIDAIEDGEKEEERLDKLRVKLEKQADKFAYHMDYSGSNDSGVYDDATQFSNVLMDDAFKPGESP